jgi:hypothetical protein
VSALLGVAGLDAAVYADVATTELALLVLGLLGDFAGIAGAIKSSVSGNIASRGSGMAALDCRFELELLPFADVCAKDSVPDGGRRSAE